MTGKAAGISEGLRQPMIDRCASPIWLLETQIADQIEIERLASTTASRLILMASNCDGF